VASHLPDDSDAIVNGRGVVFVDADRIADARLLATMQMALEEHPVGTVVTVHTGSDQVVGVVREWCRSSEPGGPDVEFLEAFAQGDGTTLVLRLR
jgi:hypothetical protein